jgi:hypothetical protein
MNRRRIQNRQASTSSGLRVQSRRGTTLVQAVITITVMSILMTVVANALFRMYRQQALMVERAFATSTWLRLDRDFRQDMHAASVVNLSEDGTQLALTMPDSRVIWIVDGENVRRIVPESEASAELDSTAAATIPGEQYVFADSTARMILTKTGDAAAVASIEVTPPLTATGVSVPPNATVATTGLDHRFATAGSASEGQP